MLPTRNHEEIRLWAQMNGATPAEVHPLTFDGVPAKLHFLFGDARAGTEDILPITWESFFARFDLLELSMAFIDDEPNFQIVRVERPLPQSSN